jgi:hypothetical protein
MVDNSFGIPARAWFIAIATIVAILVVAYAMPGPAFEGCLYQKNCNFNPRAPILFGMCILVLGSALSILIGAVPLGWVAGWTATIAGILAMTVGLFVALETPGALTSNMRIWALSGGLCFFAGWVVQMPLGLVAACVPSPFRPRILPAVSIHDHRPRWLQDIGTALALLESASLRPSDLQQVAELAFELGNDPQVPTAVRDHADRVRIIFTSALEGRALRNALVTELRAAAAAGGADPYRAR